MARPKRGPGRKILRPTSGRDWRQEREESEAGHIIQLWSGRTVRLGPPRLDRMLMHGTIPDPYTGLVYRVLFEGLTADVSDELARMRELEKLTPDALAQQFRLYEVICKAMFLEPRIVDDPKDDDEIHIDDVLPVDRTVVWELAVSSTIWGVGHLRNFRFEPEGDVADVPDREEQRLPAEPVAAASGE